MQGSERTQSWPELLSGIVIAPIIGVSLIGIPGGAQGAGRATISSSSIDSSGAVSAAMVNVTRQDQPGSSSGQALSTQQMGTIRVSRDNPTRLALIASGVQGKTGHATLIGYLLDFRKDSAAEIDQEMSAKSAEGPGVTESAL